MMLWLILLLLNVLALIDLFLITLRLHQLLEVLLNSASNRLRCNLPATVHGGGTRLLLHFRSSLRAHCLVLRLGVQVGRL